MDGKMTPQQEAILNNALENSIEAWTVLKEIDAEMQKSVPDVLPVEDQLRHLKAAETSHDRAIRLRDALVTGNEHEQDKKNCSIIWPSASCGKTRLYVFGDLSSNLICPEPTTYGRYMR